MKVYHTKLRDIYHTKLRDTRRAKVQPIAMQEKGTRGKKTAHAPKIMVPERIRRLRIPVRTEIHSSEVSTIWARSSLEIRRCGKAEPHPTSLHPLATSLKKFLIK